MSAGVVVIGAGVAGMTAALTLARRGRRVTLVERDRRVGPLLRRFRRGAAWFDGGFHYSGGLLPGGTLDVLFRAFGVRDFLEPIPLDPQGFDRLITPRGREVRLPGGTPRVREALCAAFPSSAGAVRAYVDEIERICRVTPFLHFDFEPAEILALRKGAEQSLAGFLAQAGAEPELIQTLGGYGQALYGAPGEEIPIDFHGMVMGSLYHSAHVLRRGGDSIVDALEAALRREGAQIRCGAAARRLRLNGRRLTGVELEGGELLACEECIFTAHPRLLSGMLGEGEAPALRARLDRMENSFGAFTVYLEAEETPAALRASNLYRIGEPDGEGFMAVLSCGGHDGASCEPGANDADGRHALMALMPSRWPGGGEEAYAEYKARETERVLGRLAETLPELKGRCRVLAAASPRTYAALTGTAEGSVYGIVQSVRRRPLSAMTGVPGLYLAGQSILVAGIVGAMASGVVAAAHVEDIQAIWDEIRKWQ